MATLQYRLTTTNAFTDLIALVVADTRKDGSIVNVTGEGVGKNGTFILKLTSGKTVDNINVFYTSLGLSNIARWERNDVNRDNDGNIVVPLLKISDAAIDNDDVVNKLYFDNNVVVIIGTYTLL